MNYKPQQAFWESILVGVVGTFIVIGLYFVPILNILVLLWPVAMIVLYIRRSQWAGVLALGISALTLSFFNLYLGLFSLIWIGIVMFAITYVIRNKYKPIEGIVFSGGAVLVSLVLSLKVLSIIVGQDIFTYSWDMIRNFFEQGSPNLNKILDVYYKWGILEGSMTGTQFAELIIDRLKMLVPSMLIIFSLVFGGANLLVSLWALKKFGVDVPRYPSFSTWKLPKGTGRGFLLIMVIAILGKMANVRNFDVVLMTISSIFSFVFSIQGLAVSSFFMKVGNLPKVLRIIILCIVYIFLQMALTLVGIFEQIFHIRSNYENRTPSV